MIGAAVGAGLKIGSSIFGGISASKAIKKMKNRVNQQMKENQDWYDRRYNEDSTQRADAQRLLTMTEDSIRKRNQSAEGSAAVMGGTDESTAAAKEANNKALADVTGEINAEADVRKDQIEQQYQSKKADLNNQLNNLDQQKAQAVSDAVKGVADAGSDIEGML